MGVSIFKDVDESLEFVLSLQRVCHLHHFLAALQLNSIVFLTQT